MGRRMDGRTDGLRVCDMVAVCHVLLSPPSRSVTYSLMYVFICLEPESGTIGFGQQPHLGGDVPDGAGLDLDSGGAFKVTTLSWKSLDDDRGKRHSRERSPWRRSQQLLTISHGTGIQISNGRGLPANDAVTSPSPYSSGLRTLQRYLRATDLLCHSSLSPSPSLGRGCQNVRQCCICNCLQLVY